MIATYPYPVFYLPSGPKNLLALPAFADLPFANIEEYYVELKDETDAVIFRTNNVKLGCCCDSDNIRVYFLNALGCFDAVNFNPPRILHNTSSSEYIVDGETERFNLRSNETYECVTTCYGETEMPWLKELADSPKAFMDLPGEQGQQDSYLSIRIIDKEFEEKKIENQFVYHFRLTFKLSGDNIIQRN